MAAARMIFLLDQLVTTVSARPHHTTLRLDRSDCVTHLCTLLILHGGWLDPAVACQPSGGVRSATRGGSEIWTQDQETKM
jgi:hypothetical protein